MDEGTGHEGLSRRDALKKAAVVGGAIWIAPAIQTVNMSRAMAASPPSTCSKFRVSNNKCENVDPKTSCLPSLTDPDRCDPINTAKRLRTPDDRDWTICLDAGCEVQGVSLYAASETREGPGDEYHGGHPPKHPWAACWYSQQIPNNVTHGLPATDLKGLGSWSGWSVDYSNCLHIPRPVNTKTGKKIEIAHVDVIVCCR